MDIKRIRHLIPKATAGNLYKTLSQPILEYCDVNFENTTKEINKLPDHVQWETILMLTLRYQHTTTEIFVTNPGLEHQVLIRQSTANPL